VKATLKHFIVVVSVYTSKIYNILAVLAVGEEFRVTEIEVGGSMSFHINYNMIRRAKNPLKSTFGLPFCIFTIACTTTYIILLAREVVRFDITCGRVLHNDDCIQTLGSQWNLLS